MELKDILEAMKGLGSGNLGDLMRQAQEARQRLEQARQELGRRTVTADAGAGMVQAIVNGHMELVRIHIDKARINLDDTEMLEDLVVAAVRAAQGKAADMARQEMQRFAAESGLPPGMIG